MADWGERLRDRGVGIVGLGYAGLPLALAFAREGFGVVGIDLDARRVEAVNRGEPVLVDVPASRYREVAGRLSATGDYHAIADVDALTVCVPTPLSKTRTPDLSYVIAATEALSEHLRPGQLVVLQSTTYRERFWALFVAALERLAVPRADAVVTVSDGIAERLRERYRLSARPTVLRNVSALRSDGPAAGEGLRDRLGLGDEPLLLHQGAAATGRGGEHLVRTTALLPEAHLVFLGDGEPACELRLRELAAQLGVADRVHLARGVALERLLDLTREADLELSMLEDTCENHRLAIPNKVFEYLAAEVPVVVNDLPELRRLVSDYGIGWTAPAADPHQLAQTCARRWPSAGTRRSSSDCARRGRRCAGTSSRPA